MNGENLHLPVPPVPMQLQPKQPNPQRAQLRGGARAWREGPGLGPGREGARCRPRSGKGRVTGWGREEEAGRAADNKEEGVRRGSP